MKLAIVLGTLFSMVVSLSKMAHANPPARPVVAVVHHSDANYVPLRTFCENTPGACVRIGNTWIVQGR